MIKPDLHTPKPPDVTVEQLCELFYVDEQGCLRNRNPQSIGKRPVLAGSPAGSMSTPGYVQVRIGGRRYLAHHVVYAMCTGAWPTRQVDHIDGNRSNNHPSNLRESTQRRNQQNQEIHRNGRLPGCHFDKTSGKWRVRPRINGKHVHVGLFSTEAEAHAAYIAFVDSGERDNDQP